MPRLTTRVPKYSLHKASAQAVIRLNGRDIYLGRHGSPESKAKYRSLLAEWSQQGREHAVADVHSSQNARPCAGSCSPIIGLSRRQSSRSP